MKNNFFRVSFDDKDVRKNILNIDWPYIYMGSETVLKAGSRIPLRAYNAAGAASVHWTFDGKGISAGPDGYYEIVSEGVLKAHITWDDGSTDVLMKEMILSE